MAIIILLFLLLTTCATPNSASSRELAPSVDSESTLQELRQKLLKFSQSPDSIDRADILYRLGAPESSKESTQQLEEAVTIFQRLKANPERELVGRRLLSARMIQQKQYDAAESNLARVLVLEESLSGKKLEYAQALISYAKAAHKSGKTNAAGSAVDEALQIANAEQALDEKRTHLTALFSDAGDYYWRIERNVDAAHRMYQRAIYEGESLWYPLYSKSLNAMKEDMLMLDSAGRKKEARAVSDRIDKIASTGFDPKGKDVFKFWNGQTAPRSLGEGDPIFQLLRPSKNSKVIQGTPQEIYKTYLNK